MGKEEEDIDKLIRWFSNRNFRTPPNFLECLKCNISISENW
jgi:hypothetical protein